MNKKECYKKMIELRKYFEKSKALDVQEERTKGWFPLWWIEIFDEEGKLIDGIYRLGYKEV